MSYILSFFLFGAAYAGDTTCPNTLNNHWDLVDVFIEANAHMPVSQFGIWTFIIGRYLVDPIAVREFTRAATPEEIHRVSHAAIRMHTAFEVRPFNLHAQSRSVDADARSAELLRRIKNRVFLILVEIAKVSQSERQFYLGGENEEQIDELFLGAATGRREWTEIGEHLQEVFDSASFRHTSREFKKRFASAAHSPDSSVRAGASILGGLFDRDLTALLQKNSGRLKSDKLQLLLKSIPMGRPF